MRIEVDHTELEAKMKVYIEKLEKDIEKLMLTLADQEQEAIRCKTKRKLLDEHIEKFTDFYRENCEGWHE